MREVEPWAAEKDHLLIPQTAVVDSRKLVETFAHEAFKAGAVFLTSACALRITRSADLFVVSTATRDYAAPHFVNAAGLHADEVAWQLGAASGVVIVPFRGDNFELVPERCASIHGLLYPLKDLERPFVGVHFTKRTDGGVLVGPNAVIPPHREAYKGLRPRAETARMALDPAFIRMMIRNRAVRKHFSREILLSFSARAFLDEARRLVPSLKASDLVRTRSGIRAQLVRREDGAFVDDVMVVEQDGAVHVLNAVSPALTNALAFGRHVADRVQKGPANADRAPSSEGRGAFGRVGEPRVAA